jgi:hypothetical protein
VTIVGSGSGHDDKGKWPSVYDYVTTDPSGSHPHPVVGAMGERMVIPSPPPQVHVTSTTDVKVGPAQVTVNLAVSVLLWLRLWPKPARLSRRKPAFRLARTVSTVNRITEIQTKERA